MGYLKRYRNFGRIVAAAAAAAAVSVGLAVLLQLLVRLNKALRELRSVTVAK